MKKTIISIAFSLIIGWTIAGNDLVPAETPAQTITLKGKVVDFNSGESLTGVEVAIEGSSVKTYTDFDGNFEIKDVKPGNYNLVASYISYNNSLVENFKAADTDNNVEIKLQTSK